MHLEKVRMENFKSFGKEMEIPFQEGYTNITGPNGSGKSNIVDAILFVLGPKSSKEIRASRLTDLIFNGGKDGKAADHCKVSLTFENEDRTIPLEEERVTFTRKVKKSDNNQGYNSYFYVNGRRSTLNEFQDLLAHARISPNGYNIVQQGDIARIVEMGPTERRKILDDISGISEYDEEIEEAEEKKEDVSQDLERINILLDEINSQVEELEEDRKKALRYQELSDKKSEAKEMKAWKLLQNTENNIASIEKDIEDNKEDIESKKEDEERCREEKEELNKRIDELKDELEEKGSKKSKELQKKINDLRLDIGRADDKKEDAQHTIKENKKKREELKRLLKEKKKDLKEIKGDIRNNEEEKENISKEFEEVKEKIGDIEKKQSDSDERIKDLKKESIELNKKVDEKNDKLSNKKIELETAKDKIERIREEIASIEEDKEDLEFEKKEKEMELEDISGKNEEQEKRLDELKDEFHKKKRKEKKLREDKNDLEDRVKRLKRKYEDLKAQKEAAKSVKKGYNRAVSTILEARDKGELDGIHGTIAELADVQDKYETALKVAAGGRMQSIVVDNDSVASKAIKYLKKNDAGRATFLPLNKMRSGRPRGKALRAVKDENAVDFAIELVDYDDEYENVFWYVFHDTVVMEDIDSAREH
ncbi:MAG: AAA family ATPase, partial [Candidatus Aenigmatarchaeota archaeon]